MGGLRVAVVRECRIRYQLAIVKRPKGWRPRRWDDSPPEARVLGTIPLAGSARDVERLVREFNRSMRGIWAFPLVEPCRPAHRRSLRPGVRSLVFRSD